MTPKLAALLAGIVFGLGLTVSGMTEPDNVIAFLNLGPGWNPALMLVMGSALAVAAVGYAWLGRRASPLFDDRFHLPESTALDGPLLGGAVLFGMGWGLAGYCPGPAIVGTLTLDPRAAVFGFGFLAGALAFQWFNRRRTLALAQPDG